MSPLPHDDIRQIKWVLVGILACLIVIAVSLAPFLIPLAILAGIAYLIAALVLGVSRTARDFARGLWFDMTHLWRR